MPPVHTRRPLLVCVREFRASYEFFGLSTKNDRKQSSLKHYGVEIPLARGSVSEERPRNVFMPRARSTVNDSKVETFRSRRTPLNKNYKTHSRASSLTTRRAVNNIHLERFKSIPRNIERNIILASLCCKGPDTSNSSATDKREKNSVPFLDILVGWELSLARKLGKRSRFIEKLSQESQQPSFNTIHLFLKPT